MSDTARATRSWIVRYSVALLVTAAAIGLRMALTPLVGVDRVPYMTLFVAMFFIGWYCGVVPGLLSVVLGAMAVNYFILPPLHSLEVDDPHMFAGMLMFVVMGSVCVLMGDMVARSENRAQINERLAVARKEQLERATVERERLATIVESSDDAIIAKDLNGIITSWNLGAERLFGYSRAEAIGLPVTMLIPPERHDEAPQILSRIRRGERIEHYETVRRRKDGSDVHISLSISPLHDAVGRIIGASKIARDITQRRDHEQTLAAYRDGLEDLVRERTAEVIESQSRLRHAERMASIGTLSAGLGHDIGNMLLPLDVHIRRVANHIEAGTASGEATQESFSAIERAIEYLRNLSNGLRMLTRDASDRSDADASVDLGSWWKEVRPLLAALAQRSISLRHEIPPGIPAVRLPKHLLTQVAFNLVQNAVHALTDRTDGVITIRAAAAESAEVLLQVIDNGRGMPHDVQQRCLEPFFTTKIRGISSGLGLAIVNGILANAGGSVQIESEVGRGTTFTLRLPAAAPAPAAKLTAELSIDEHRLRAMVISMLNACAIHARPIDANRQPDGDAQLWIVDARAVPDVEVRARRFLNGADGSCRRVLLLKDTDATTGLESDRVTVIDRDFRPARFREALACALRELPA